MSLAVNSIDMDLSKGVFNTDGYIALTWYCVSGQK